jgi:hypothetical protein
VKFRNKIIFYGEHVGLTPNPQAGGPPLVGCHDCLFNIIGATLHIRNLRTRRAVVTRDPLNMTHTHARTHTHTHQLCMYVYIQLDQRTKEVASFLV